MADRCAGCTNKYGFFERPSICPECHRNFCQTCLPYRGKKVKKSEPQVSLEPCVYCKRQKAINKSQEEEILSNFQERYYSRTHVEPPIQSTLRLDLVMRQNSGSSPTQQHKGVELSEEDKALEERLRKLRESSHKSVAPSYSEEEMRAKLEALRQEVSRKKGDGGEGEEGKDAETEKSSTDLPGSQHSGSTQTEQADQLLEQATDEARIDDKLRQSNEGWDEELLKRFQALKGAGKDTRKYVRLQPDSTTTKASVKLNFDVEEMLDGMDDPVFPEDAAEKLLQDLKSLQAKEETAATREAESGDIQQLISVAQKLAKDETTVEGGSGDPLPNIVYPDLVDLEAPSLEGTPQVAPTGNSEVSNAEVAKLLEEERDELKHNHEQHEANVKFVEQASERLNHLRSKDHTISYDLPTSHDLLEDEVVKSKPKAAVTAHPKLEFTWSHFGAHPTNSAHANERGFPREGGTSSGGFPGGENREEFSGEVQQLISQMLEEAELDQQLEASGLSIDRNPPEMMTQSGKSVAGATALHAATGAVGGACSGDLDDLPWCCICNDDASICCYDCDGDLYCQRCFTDGHQQFGLVDHKYSPYQPPNK